MRDPEWYRYMRYRLPEPHRALFGVGVPDAAKRKADWSEEFAKIDTDLVISVFSEIADGLRPWPFHPSQFFMAVMEEDRTRRNRIDRQQRQAEERQLRDGGRIVTDSTAWSEILGTDSPSPFQMKRRCFRDSHAEQTAGWPDIWVGDTSTPTEPSEEELEALGGYTAPSLLKKVSDG